MLLEGGAYLKFCAEEGVALIRGGRLLDRGRLLEEIQYPKKATLYLNIPKSTSRAKFISFFG